MPTRHAVIAALLTGVIGTGIGTLQARAGDAAPRPGATVTPLPAIATPTPTPVASVVRSPASQPRPVVRFPDRLSAGWGIDISWPQCDRPLPAVPAGFAILGINGGRPFTANPCLRKQLADARPRLPLSAYLNLGAPGAGDAKAYARRVVDDGLARMARLGIRVPVVWLDVEIANPWRDATTNVAVIGTALARLRASGVQGGIYSSQPMWQQITGGAAIHVPVWLAITGSEVPTLRHACTTGLGGAPATMVQYVATAPQVRLIDADVLCRTDVGVLKLFART
jgi:hypothetical protein